MRKNNKYYIRKVHRYLGVAIGVQFIFWTVSGLYFSWTDLDEIHGDHFHKPHMHHEFTDLLGINQIDSTLLVSSLNLRHIVHEPYYWVNDSLLFHAKTGKLKKNISEEDAKKIARNNVKNTYKISGINLLTETDSHHEYRKRPLPAYAVSFEGNDNLVAYVDQRNGSFERIRHKGWRWFDFLWMTHTMDYQGRDNFNNLLLRVFSLCGLVTVASGFVLYAVTTKRIRIS